MITTLSVTALALDATTMNHDVRSKIEEAAADELGWSREQTNLTEIRNISLPPCAFVNARNNRSTDPYGVDFAVLPNGVVISGNQDEGAKTIFDACGATTDANAWAEILTRFHLNTEPFRVLYALETSQERAKFEAAGKDFAAPSLTVEQNGTTARFYMMNFETGVFAQVTATRLRDGEWAVNVWRSAS